MGGSPLSTHIRPVQFSSVLTTTTKGPGFIPLGCIMATRKMEDEFNNLKKEFIGLQNMIQDLLEKHGDLEKKYEKFIQKQRKVNFKCRGCGDKFEVLKHLKDHKESGCSRDKIKCDVCEKYFKDEETLEEHKKIHDKFECDECDKEFTYEAVLEKHREAAHEGVELFCHYFNNEKDCPFDDECISIHEDSAFCKFGNVCERKFCMFRHEESKTDKCESEEDSDDDDEEIEINDANIEKIKPVLEKF